MKKESRNQKINAAIKDFFKDCKRNKQKNFHSYDLINYVCSRIGTNYIYPDTILRELRSLRQSGVLNYEVFNRSSMRYDIKKVCQ
jgi:hypothetical protein